jgi:8-oxo-dGTP pyrophosphatase MutT (NUDIX family)
VTAPTTERGVLTAQIRDRLATLSVHPPPPTQADAAVLILLRTGPGGLEVLAEQRAEQPGDPWSGQVGLPGGHKEPGDRSLTETVLRELREEVGIPASDLEGRPRLFDLRRARPSGLRVAVFAGCVAGNLAESEKLNRTEVTTTFWFPLPALDNTESRPRQTQFGEIQVEAVTFEGHVVWGFTLRVLQDFVSWLGGPETPSAPFSGELRPWRSQAL